MLIRSSVRKVTLGIFSALIVVLSVAPVAVAQDALLTGLQQKFHITQINMQGVAAVPGTVLTIQADGINAEPYPTMITFENPVVDGQVKQRSKGFGLLRSTNSQVLQPGQKVYITKIHSSTNSHEDDLKITFLTCDAVLATFTNGNYGGQYQAAKRYSGTLAFKLPKGALTEMSPDDAAKLVEAVLTVNPADQVRAIDAGTVARSCEPHCAVSTTTGTVVGGAVVAPQGGAPAAAPPTIALGQSIDQVTANMGAPQQIIDLGSKKIYKYADMKVIFMNDKVSDVQ
ncbi:MAG TPA: hypothetical protein VGU67_07245 [Edaphobacter sp.]|nr:hypothetical protein [Edaphobacter sp.]